LNVVEYSNAKPKSTAPSSLTSFSRRDDNISNDYGHQKPPKPKVGAMYQDRPASHEEVSLARTHLQLLKSKMKQTNGFVHTDLKSIERPGGDSGKHSFDSGSYDEEVYDVKPKGTLSKRPETTANANYRKPFKPELKSQNSLQEDVLPSKNLNSTQTKTAGNRITSARGREYNPEDYVNDSYGYGGKPDKKPPMSAAQKGSAKKPSYSRQDEEEIPIYTNSKTSQQKRLSGYGVSDEPSYDNFGANKGKLASNQKSGAKNTRAPTAEANTRPFDYDKENDRKLPTTKNRDELPAYSKKGTSNPIKSSNYNNFEPTYDDDRPIKPATKQFPLAANEYTEDELIECPEGCGRRFNPKALEKHAKVCQKVFQEKRKAFNSAQQRITEDLIALQNEKKKPTTTMGGKRSTIVGKQPELKTTKFDDKPVKGEEKKAKWKAQSEAFRAGLKAARGQKLTKEEQMAFNNAAQEDLIPCQFCGRKFNEKAAAKHIPFCESKAKQNQIKLGGKARK